MSAHLQAPAESRLEQLLAQYAPARAAYEEALANFEAVKNAIKATATVYASEAGSDSITVSGRPGLPVLSVRWAKQWRLNTARLKEEQPETYVRYAEQHGRWELREQA